MDIKEDLKLLNRELKKSLQTENLTISFQTKKIIAAVLVIFFLFSGLSLSTSKRLIVVEKQNIESKFESKDQRLMSSILFNCKGNLYDPEHVQMCIDETKKEMLKEHKHKLLVNGFLRALWVLSIIGIFVAALIYKNKNKKRRNEEADQE